MTIGARSKLVFDNNILVKFGSIIFYLHTQVLAAD